ncbi:MAG: aldo/keto reductase, partial [Rhizobiaceae bacterium]|nr:aldo/keto reductase [Rhizobiaceae bacterium]
QIERELLPLAEEQRIAVIPYNPIAGGLLTGKHRHEALPTTGRFSSEMRNAGANYLQRYWHEREFATVEKLRGIASEAGHSLTTLAVAWVAANPVITSAIIGASRPDQLTDTLAGIELKLDADLKAKLDDATVEYRWGDAAR